MISCPKGNFCSRRHYLFYGEAQTSVEVDVPGLVLEVILNVAAVVEIVAGGRLDINAEILGYVELQAWSQHSRELHAVLVDVDLFWLLDCCLDVEIERF